MSYELFVVGIFCIRLLISNFQFLIFNYANLLELGDIENELEHLKNEFIK